MALKLLEFGIEYGGIVLSALYTLTPKIPQKMSISVRNLQKKYSFDLVSSALPTQSVNTQSSTNLELFRVTKLRFESRYLDRWQFCCILTLCSIFHSEVNTSGL